MPSYPVPNPYQTPQQYPFPPQQYPYPPQPLVNTAQMDPWLADFHKSWQARVGELQADEGRLRSESDARTKQMISQASGDIADRAAGANASLSEDLSRRGVAGAGVESGQRQGIGEAAQREQARQATNIALTNNREYESQKLARQGMLNNFLAGGLASAGAIGQRQLDAQRLGLDQWQAGNNQNRQDYNQYVNQIQQRANVPSYRPPAGSKSVNTSQYRRAPGR